MLWPTDTIRYNMIWLQLLWCQPFCHSDHSTLLFFTRTCITGCKAQSSGFVLANTHLAMVENEWQQSYQIHSQMLGRGKHQLKANNQKWNVKSCVQIWILTTCLHESQKVWNRSYSRVWTTNESNRHQKNRQLWQSPSSPVNVTLHLFASSLGYISRRSCIWGSAGVPCIQMKAAICKVSVRGEQITGINV